MQPHGTRCAWWAPNACSSCMPRDHSRPVAHARACSTTRRRPTAPGRTLRRTVKTFGFMLEPYAKYHTLPSRAGAASAGLDAASPLVALLHHCSMITSVIVIDSCCSFNKHADRASKGMATFCTKALRPDGQTMGDAGCMHAHNIFPCSGASWCSLLIAQYQVVERRMATRDSASPSMRCTFPGLTCLKAGRFLHSICRPDS